MKQERIEKDGDFDPGLFSPEELEMMEGADGIVPGLELAHGDVDRLMKRGAGHGFRPDAQMTLRTRFSATLRTASRHCWRCSSRSLDASTIRARFCVCS